VSRRRGESGYSLVALLAAIAVMMILLAAAMPSWRYVMRNDAEEELLSRGGQIADAIARYQRRQYRFRGRHRHYLAIPFEGRYIWGATAGMLYNLCRLLRR